MNALAHETIDAHGGLARWQQFEQVTARLRNGGVLWALKGHDGVIEDVRVRVGVRRQWASHGPIGDAGWRTSFAPDRVAIETADGRIVEERVEREPWSEGGEVWRRLEVSFPDTIATHGPVQTFYVGSDGLLRRHDYDAEVLGGTPAAHYLHDYATFDGIQVPTRRRVYVRGADGVPAPEPVVVSIDLSDVEFT